MNLDRFSRPLDSERVNPYFLVDAIEEQRYLNKRDIVSSFIENCWNEGEFVPDAEMIQENFYKIDLDEDMINELIKIF